MGHLSCKEETQENPQETSSSAHQERMAIDDDGISGLADEATYVCHSARLGLVRGLAMNGGL